MIKKLTIYNHVQKKPVWVNVEHISFMEIEEFQRGTATKITLMIPGHVITDGGTSECSMLTIMVAEHPDAILAP